jgi:hypothetical protein
MSAQQSPQDAALAYAACGWPVFPCQPGSKVPATPRGFLDASTDERQIRDWWRRNPDRNVAIATGAPGPDVVDVDNHGEQGNGYAALNRLKREGLVDGYHAVVQTPSRGIHLYYAGTDQRSGAIRGQHLDFRSQGGYIVAPPSRHGDAGYEVVQHSPTTGRTVSWRAIQEHLQPQASPERAAPQRQAEGDTGRLDRLVEFVAAGVPNDRNFRVFYAAKQAALHGLLDRGAEERFVDALRRADPSCDRSAEARRSVASGQRAAAREASPRPFARAPQRELEAG